MPAGEAVERSPPPAVPAVVPAVVLVVMRPRTGFNSEFKSEKLVEVLIRLDRLSKLIEPLITY